MSNASASGGCRVLIVEDDDQFAETLATMLEQDERFQLIGRVRDGQEGVELAATLAPDAILMDVEMPVMDGIEATREIHQQQPQIPVLAISGYDYSDRALDARQAGAVDYLRKSRIADDLLAALLAAASTQAA